MAAPKRPNYFQSQFLVVRDFQDEQSYHRESLQRHNRLLHEWGVIREGLQVTKPDNNYSISPGSAIDSSGNEIILDTARALTAADVQAARQASGAGQDVYVTIAFQEVDSSDAADKYPPPGGTENVTRKVQSPNIVATKSPATDGSVVILAKIAGDGTANNLVRKLASSIVARGTNLGDISLDGALSFTSKTSPIPQVGLDYDPAGDQLRIRARKDASVLDTTYLTIKRDSGNVGIGTPNAPGQKLEVHGALKLTANPNVSNDNMAAYFWNQAQIGPTIAGFSFEVRTNGDVPRLKIYSNGNVGIGTTTNAPNQKLEVAGVLKLSSNSTVINDQSGAYFWNQETVGPTIAGGKFEVRTGGDTPRLRIDNTGKVSIGTTDAVARLYVLGSGSAVPATSATAQSAGHVTRLRGSTNHALDIGSGGDKGFWLQSTDVTNLATNNPLLLNPNGGNVGIGTTTPRSSLHIRKDNQSGLGPTFTLMNGAGVAGAKVHIDLHTYWDDARPNPSGRIICEDNAKASGNLIFQIKEDNAETMWERLRIEASGNVGIGTNAPKAKLDVGDTKTFTMKAILARLPEANPGTFLGVKSYDTDVNADKSFAIEHYFYNERNCAINFHRGGGVFGGYITFDANNGAEKMRLHDSGLEVKGSISCGGKIGIYSPYWKRYLSARGAGAQAVTMEADKLQYQEEFTLQMSCSREFKENISDLTALEAMTTLQNLTPVKYDYKGEKAFRQNLGFIAEDMPDNVASEDRKTISPFEVVPILTKVAKEQQRVIAELQETVRTLQEDMRQH